MIDQHASLSEKFLKKGFWLYLFSFIIAPIWYIIKIIISSELTVSEIGILYGVISLIAMLSSYNDLWMNESLKYFIPKFVTEKRFDKIKSILFYALFVQIITSALIAFFFYFWADYISNNYFKTYEAKETLKVFAFYFVGINIYKTINNFFMAVQDTYYHQISDFVRMWFIMISVIFMFFWNMSTIINYSYTWLIWLYFWTILSLILFYKKYYKTYFKENKILINRTLIKKVSKYASIVFIWASAWTILWQIDMQMIIYLLWTVEAWYYTNYLSIIRIPLIMIWPIFGLLFPVFSELYSKKEYKKIKLIKTIFSMNFIIIWIMINIFFFVFSEIIAYVLFWEKFLTSWIILKYSILLLVFNFLFSINFCLLSWIWRVKKRLKIIIVAIIFNFILNLVLINKIWTYWAALSTWLGWMLMYLLSELLLRKKFIINYDYIYIWKNIIIMWLFGYIINFLWFNTLNWLNRINSFSLLILFFLIWLWIFIIINYNKMKVFISEIRKIRN